MDKSFTPALPLTPPQTLPMPPATTGAPAPLSDIRQTGVAPATPTWGPADLRQFHANGNASPAKFPDHSHAQAVQEKNLERQTAYKQLDAIEKEIQKNRPADDTSNVSRALTERDVEAEREKLKERHKQVKARLNGSQTSPTSDSDDEDVAYPVKSVRTRLDETGAKIRDLARQKRKAEENGEEKKSQKLDKQLAELKQEQKRLQDELSANDDHSSSVTITDGDSDDDSHDAGFSTSSSTSSPGSLGSEADPLAAMAQAIGERTKLLDKLQKNLDQLGDGSEDAQERKECEEGAQVLKEEIRTLQSVVDMLGGGQAPGDDVDKPATLSALVRTKTTRKPRQASSSSSTTSLARGGQADLKGIHEGNRRSSMFLKEDLKQQFSEQALAEIETIEKEMVDLAKKADSLQKKINATKKYIARSEAEAEDGDPFLAADRKKLKAQNEQWLKYTMQITKLLEEKEKLENRVLPQELKSAKQLEDEYQAFVGQYKSPKTLDAEKNHKAMLDKLSDRAEKNWWYTFGHNFLSGGLGFSVSFLLGNSTARWVPPVHGIWVPAVISGALHVITATPMVKQVQARVWNASSLSELNNNFKLRGAGWSDWWRGETDKAKYVSRDTDKPVKLTIDERMAQEKTFVSLLGKRYKDEEAGYWAYTMNYTFKAAAMAAASSYFAGFSDASRGIETFLHGVAGWISGAEYIVFQQDARSKRPGAKATAVPTREIFAADAAAKESLREDLKKGLAALKAKKDVDPNDTTERQLHKAIARTERERDVAEQKSRVLGIMRYEFKAQFQGETKWDTLSEALGRIITLAPIGVVSFLTASWRKSPDPMMMFLGHFLPAVALMIPLPTTPVFTGFTARPVVSGIIRAGIQMFLNRSAKPAAAARAVPPQTAAQQDASKVVAGSSGGASRRPSLDESAVVSVPEDASDTSDSDDDLEEIWRGNPLQRDEDAAN